MKQEALAEHEQFRQRHGLGTQKGKRRKSIYVEQPAELSSDKDDGGQNAPKPKKPKLSSPNADESSDSEPPTKQITAKSKSPIKSPVKSNPVLASVDQKAKDKGEVSKKEKKLNSLSVSSDFNDRVDSELTSSSPIASPKKKSKKQKKEKSVAPPGPKPPQTEFEYFAKEIHTGKPRKAQKAYKKLTEQERLQLTAAYTEKVDGYMAHMKKYLKSLSKEDAAAYVSVYSIFDSFFHPYSKWFNSFQIEKVKEEERRAEQENNSQGD